MDNHQPTDQHVPRVGLLLFGCRRFKEMGHETPEGPYHARVEHEAKAVISSLEAHARVVVPPIVYERSDLLPALDELNSSHVDAIIAVFLSWSEDFAWVRFLRDAPQLPMLLYLPTRPRAFPNHMSESDFVEFLAAGGLVGTLEASGSISRMNRAVQVVVGPVRERLGSLRAFIDAARVRRQLREAHFAFLASFNELMWSTWIDPYRFFRDVGPELHFVSYGEYVQTIESVPESEVVAEVRRIEKLYAVSPDIDRGEKFTESVRASLGLGQLILERGYSGLALNDVAAPLLEAIGLRPGFYPESVRERRAPIVPEADLGLLTAAYIAKQLSGDHINVVEPFYVDENTGRFAAGHAGPNDHTDTASIRNVRVDTDVRFARTSYRHAGAPFAWYRIPEGQKTFVHFSEGAHRYKIIVFLAKAVDGDHFISSFAHGEFETERPARDLFEAIAGLGSTQHFAVMPGDFRDSLSQLAGLCGFDFVDATKG